MPTKMPPHTKRRCARKPGGDSRSVYVSRIHLRSLRPDAPRGQEDTKLTLLHDGVVPQGAAWLARVQVRVVCVPWNYPCILPPDAGSRSAYAWAMHYRQCWQWLHSTNYLGYNMPLYVHFSALSDQGHLRSCDHINGEVPCAHNLI